MGFTSKFFKKKSDEELERELTKTKATRMKIEGRAKLKSDLREEKKKIFQARYGGVINTLKTIQSNVVKNTTPTQEPRMRKAKRKKSVNKNIRQSFEHPKGLSVFRKI